MLLPDKNASKQGPPGAQRLPKGSAGREGSREETEVTMLDRGVDLTGGGPRVSSAAFSGGGKRLECPRSRAAQQLARQVEEEAQRLFSLAEQMDRALRQMRSRQRQAWSRDLGAES